MDGRIENKRKVEQYLTQLIQDKPSVLKDYYMYLSDKTHNTKKTYISHVIRFLTFLESKEYDIFDINTYNNVKPYIINEYLANTEYKLNGEIVSDAYKTLQINVLKSFFEFLIDYEIIHKNPCKNLKAPKSNKQISVIYLTSDEIQVLKGNVRNGVGNQNSKDKQKEWFERDYAIVCLELCTGLRVSALVEINLSDIFFAENKIRVTEKENITKDVYINEEVCQVLKDWLVKRDKFMKGYEPTDALFISHLRKRMSTKSVNEIVKKYTYNIDKKITAHKLRSTFGMNVYEATGDIYITSELLGHSNVETTKRYACVTEEKRRKAIEDMMKTI